ncbi:Coiled-coil domain-containing protein 33 [Physocladia obscura]|uniref:Coiled-coil domain-containing protein 33 n=1 Tax=Physocladia obscura TaxID=109957 RepID=A0AAD5SS91_9FUNG|nr:Coiled-coil domain-containing protein 33 [Physocladia obscura]
MPETFEVTISEAEFEDEGNFYIKFEVQFYGLISPYSPRTDVSTPPSRYPQFHPNSFTFEIPSRPMAAPKLIGNYGAPPFVNIKISATRVDKTPDGTSSVLNIGQFTVKFIDKSSIIPGSTVLAKLTPDTLTKIRSKTNGHIKLLFNTHSDSLKGALNEISSSPRITFTQSKLESRSLQVPEINEDERQKLAQKSTQISDQKHLSVFIFPKDGIKTGQVITIYIHSIWNLPTLNNFGTENLFPSPFVSVKTADEAASGIRAKFVTHTAEQGRSAYFGEKFLLEFNEPYSQYNTQEIFLSILDETTKRFIAKFVLPISAIHFPSHRQINLILKSVSTLHKDVTPSIRISIKNENTAISEPSLLQREYSSKMIIFECYLRGIVGNQLPFSCPQKRFEENCPTIFPQLNPHVQLEFDSNGTLISEYPLVKYASVPFIIYEKNQQNIFHKSSENIYYQMTASSLISANPEWNESFLALNAETSLAIEFYRDPPITEKCSELPISDFVAYAMIPLGDFTTISLTENRSAIQLTDVRMNFIGQYKNQSNRSKVFCAIDLKVPDDWSKLNPNSFKQHYQLSPEHTKNNTPWKGSFEQLLEMIRTERENEIMAAASAAERRESLESKQLTFKYSDMEQRQRLIDKLLNELENRSLAIKKIGEDLLSSRERNAKLENKIKLLETKLQEAETKTNQLLNTIDIKDIPLVELQRRYTSMADRLKTEIESNKRMSLQLETSNLDLIERNDFETKYLELQQAHMAQQNLLQKLQHDCDSINQTKKTIKKQEDVISKLGGFLKDRLPANIQSNLLL